MSLMWMPPQTTRPPLRTAASAGGNERADRREEDRRVERPGGLSSEPPAQSAPSERANACPAASPGRVKAKTRRPCQRPTWAMMCAAAPKP